MSRNRFEAMVTEAIDGYQWNGRKRKSPVNLRQIAVQLLRREHAAITRAVKRLEQYEPPGGHTCIYLEDVLALLAARKGRTK